MAKKKRSEATSEAGAAMTRRQAIKRASLAFLGAGAGLAFSPPASGVSSGVSSWVNRGRFRLFATSNVEYSARAVELVSRATVIDMLSPLTLNFPKQNRWFADPESFTPADLQPFKDSGINVFHIGVGLGGADAYNQTLQFFAVWNGFLANHDQHFMRIDSAGDLERVKKSGKVGILLGLQ